MFSKSLIFLNWKWLLRRDKNRIVKRKSTIFMNKSIFHIFLIIILGLLAYSNTFHVPFHWDDNGNIIENYKLRDMNNFSSPLRVKMVWLSDLRFELLFRRFEYHWLPCSQSHNTYLECIACLLACDINV